VRLASVLTLTTRGGSQAASHANSERTDTKMDTLSDPVTVAGLARRRPVWEDNWLAQAASIPEKLRSVMMTNLQLDFPERSTDRSLDKQAKRRSPERTKLKPPLVQQHDARGTKATHQTPAELQDLGVPGEGIFLILVNPLWPPSKEEGIFLNPKLV